MKRVTVEKAGREIVCRDIEEQGRVEGDGKQGLAEFTNFVALAILILDMESIFTC